MGVDFSELVYLPNFDFWARPITVYPFATYPDGSYTLRGILDTRGTVIQTDAGLAVISDQETILDIREREFSTTPVQGDIIDIPADGENVDGVGLYEVIDASWNGGGEVTLVIRKYTPPPPTP